MPVKIWTDDVEDMAVGQLQNVANLPFVFKHVAAMPDVHYGKGATIGSVIACKRAVIPAAVGVDIGCGMYAVKTNLRAYHLPDNLGSLRSAIEGAVPVGHASHSTYARGPHGAPLAPISRLEEGYRAIQDRHPLIQQRDPARLARQLGTLGGGNHFVELCVDHDDSVWVMLHSGSRNVGKVIADYFISKAKDLMERFHVELVDKDLAYLPEGEPLFDDYCEAVQWAQDYALENRAAMMRLVLDVLKRAYPGVRVLEGGTNCHHNYVSLENHFGQNVVVTRKGAIRARDGELGIIPGSMGAKSFIVRGRGNRDSFHSCSHGAGRRMSRTAARGAFTVADLKQQTEGVECRKDSHVLDEIPGAYKDIDQVMENQSDLVDVVATLRQVLCVKG